MQLIMQLYASYATNYASYASYAKQKCAKYRQRIRKFPFQRSSGSLAPWISLDIIGYHWISLDIIGYAWISLDIF